MPKTERAAATDAAPSAQAAPNHKPLSTAISLRLTVSLLERIKTAVDKRDAPCRSLITIRLATKTNAAGRWRRR